MPSIPELEPPISNGRVRLRDAAERDIPEILIAHQDDPTLHARLGMPRPPSGAELGRALEREAEQRATGAGALLAIADPQADEFRGQVIVREVEWVNQRAELAVWIAPQARGRGLAPVALTLAARWLLESCGSQRIELLVDPDNQPMLAAARAAGFLEEGTLRGYELERGRRRDAISLSLLVAEL